MSASFSRQRRCARVDGELAVTGRGFRPSHCGNGHQSNTGFPMGPPPKEYPFGAGGLTLPQLDLDYLKRVRAKYPGRAAGDDAEGGGE